MEGNANTQGLVADFKRVGGSKTRIRLRMRWSGGSFTDTLDVMNAISRTKCVNKIMKQHEGLDRAEIEAALDDVASKISESAMEEGDEEQEQLSGTDDKILIDIASDKELCELFHTGAKHDAIAYARVLVDGHWENWPVKSAAFEHWLRHAFFVRLERSPSAQGFTDALHTITALALYEGESVPVYLRIAALDDMTVIDLGDDQWRVVIIRATGWQVVDAAVSPVRFTRKRGMAALPMPIGGGALEPLRRFANVPTDDLWVLLSCTMVVLVRGRGPFVVVLFLGEQGSAKSSTVKKVRSLIDPSIAPARRLPKDERDAAIAAGNAYLMVCDNASSIPPAISDALCSLATGGGFATRELYSDDDEKIFQAMRPVFINGIGDITSREDLLDRALLLNLPRIQERNRKQERLLDAEFEKVRPHLFGALLDAASKAMRHIHEVSPDGMPRMADFAALATAAEIGLGHPKGAFLAAYRRNREEAVAVALETSVVYGPLRDFMHDRDTWQGTCGELLQLLSDRGKQESKWWPKTPRGLSDALKRVAPAMRTVGIDVEFLGRKPGGKRERIVRIRVEDDPGRSSPPPDRPGETASQGPGEAFRDGRDGRDGLAVRPQPYTQNGDEHGLDGDAVAGAPAQPSRSSRPSRNGPEDTAKADLSGRSPRTPTVPDGSGDDDEEVL